ncbi:ATP-binding protein [Pseudonocardia humida]|uniref:HTH luxR-type domain-containing protein n=1 Tax=Pseudonocardia humida TaxID=2800819 RepID=A0ABT0ZZP6_9PSEU|nr:LuxR C-terminal-related transcriptional regulator [Pseudonocardia humida]MCO1656221.1 hypothetical protein [Pseudonocardia humida]
MGYGGGRSGTADTGVTQREAEVLAAVGEHLTNAEIAARLVISVRTVESHVSALLRKLAVADRRALSELAAERAAAGAAAPAPPTRPAAPLPSALTPFVGRAAERAELAGLLVGALDGQRLVSAVGPGGVGKTRLALAVAADLSDRVVDGVWYVDLVPVTDPAMLAPTVAAALGLGEQPGRTADDTLLEWVADRRAVLVLDNCEHLLDPVALLVERLLAAGPELVVLTTSRARLMLPFERVFPVAGLAVPDGGGDGGDAVALFEQRAAAAGSRPDAADRARVRRICAGLDGVPLAIELAAARLPALGLDGLEAGLADRLDLLAGARRADERHRSLRATLDWSCALLPGSARAVLRRVSVFAGPFPAADAAAVAGWAPVRPREVGAQLAVLAEHSLLVPVPGPDGTRYRTLETVRQYGAELLDDAGETDDTRLRHLDRVAATGRALLAGADADAGPGGGGRRVGFDHLADELRAAVGWAATVPAHRGAAHDTAVLLGALCLRRGRQAEAQRRFELAAELAEDDAGVAAALGRAAAVASARLAGDDALRLLAAAAEASLLACRPTTAAYQLAVLAELVNRGPGIIARPPDPDTAARLIERAGRLAGTDPAALARIATAQAFELSEISPEGVAASERALRLAREAGDLVAESAALDRAITIELSRGSPRGALATAERRIALLRGLPVDADPGFEVADAHVMATESAIAAGRLEQARRYADAVAALPQFRETGHVAPARLIIVSFLQGDWDRTLVEAERFRESWVRAGRPRVPTLRRTAHSVATLHGLRGEEAERAEWLAVFDALVSAQWPEHDRHPSACFDALLLLHRGRPDEAVRRMLFPPGDLVRWYDAIWRPWYAAMWAEAGVLAGLHDAAERVAAARASVSGNPIATALVERAAALLDGDTAGVLAAAAALGAAGDRLQSARSLVLAGGPHRDRGAAALAELRVRMP